VPSSFTEPSALRSCSRSARGQQAREVDEVAARGIDIAVGTRCAGRVVLEIEIERALGREHECARGVRDDLVVEERVGRIRQAVQGQVDRDDAETGLCERAGDRERVRAVARDAMLEDHDRPAGRRLGVSRIRVRQRQQDRNFLRVGLYRKWVGERDVRRGRIEPGLVVRRDVRTRRGMPETGQWRRRVARGRL
jgi:hypothetical protein